MNSIFKDKTEKKGASVIDLNKLIKEMEPVEL
jgi:hypothetical protein